MLLQNKSKCTDLERENRRLRKELEEHSKYAAKSREALVKLTAELESSRAQTREIKSRLEGVRTVQNTNFEHNVVNTL